MQWRCAGRCLPFRQGAGRSRTLLRTPQSLPSWRDPSTPSSQPSGNPGAERPRPRWPMRRQAARQRLGWQRCCAACPYEKALERGGLWPVFARGPRPEVTHWIGDEQSRADQPDAGACNQCRHRSRPHASPRTLAQTPRGEEVEHSRETEVRPLRPARGVAHRHSGATGRRGRRSPARRRRQGHPAPVPRGAPLGEGGR